MIAVIRIAGMVGLNVKVEATLQRLRLGRKYSCVLLNLNSETKGMLQKARACIAYGEISKETLKLLILKRGRLPGNKPVDAKKISDAVIGEIFAGKKNIADLGLKPFFRLHPPLHGFKKGTNQFYPKGVLGGNKGINELIGRML